MNIGRFLLAAVLVLLPSIVLAGQSGQWGVHLASYKLEANVHNGWLLMQAAYPDLLAGLSPRRVVADIPGKGTFVRLVAGPIPNQADAEALRRQFVMRGKYADVLALPATATPPRAQPLTMENIPLCSAMDNLQVRIRHVDTHDLIGMDANPVRVVVPQTDNAPPPRSIASRAYKSSTDPRALARKDRSVVETVSQKIPKPATVTFHSDILTQNTNTGAAPDLSPGGEEDGHEFAGVAIGNGTINVTPGLCRIGDQVAPYAGIGVAF